MNGHTYSLSWTWLIAQKSKLRCIAWNTWTRSVGRSFGVSATVSCALCALWNLCLSFDCVVHAMRARAHPNRITKKGESQNLRTHNDVYATPPSGMRINEVILCPIVIYHWPGSILHTHNVFLHERRWDTIRDTSVVNWRRRKIVLCLPFVVLWNCAYFKIEQRRNQTSTFARRGRKKRICSRLKEISDGCGLQCAQMFFTRLFFSAVIS